MHKKSRLQKNANGQGRDLSNLQIAKSLPISLYDQIIHMFHQGDRRQGTTSYGLRAVKVKEAKAMPQVLRSRSVKIIFVRS